MTQTLYDILGVPKDASFDAIKAAYKAKAKHMHPDKGGDTEEFAKLAQAYEVLSEEDSRSRYDMTGLTTRPPPFEEEVMKCLVQVIGKAVDHFVSNGAWNMEEPVGNLLDVVTSVLQANKRQFDADLRKIRRRLKVMQTIVTKAKPRESGKSDTIFTLLNGSIAQQEQAAANLEASIKVIEACMERVNNLDWTGGKFILPGSGWTTSTGTLG